MKNDFLDFKKYKKYFGSHASQDLNKFLEGMPVHAGRTVLIAAGIAWGIAAGAGLFAVMTAQNLTTVRAELQETQSLKPPVPEIKYGMADTKDLERFKESAEKIYRGLSINVSRNDMMISANSTSGFPEFREAIGHLHNAGKGWVFDIRELCVGRECKKRGKLHATLTTQKISIEKPQS